MIGPIIETTLWLLTITFVVTVIHIMVRNKPINEFKSLAAPFSLILFVTVLTFAFLSVFLPQTKTDASLFLVNFEGNGPIEYTEDGKARVYMYQYEADEIFFLEIDEEDINVKDTDKVSSISYIDFRYPHPLLASIFRVLEKEELSINLNKVENMTYLYKDGYLYGAGYNLDRAPDLNKVKEELNSLEEQLNEE